MLTCFSGEWIKIIGIFATILDPVRPDIGHTVIKMLI